MEEGRDGGREGWRKGGMEGNPLVAWAIHLSALSVYIPLSLLTVP